MNCGPGWTAGCSPDGKSGPQIKKTGNPKYGNPKINVGPNRRRRQLGPSALPITQELYLKQQTGKIGEKTSLLKPVTV
jgi:hypothetical protein